MFNLNFSNNYRVVHINNELGNCVVGGAGTYMNELYHYRRPDTGFIYMSLGSPLDDYKVSDFMEQRDILIMNHAESYKLKEIKCDVLVVQFYEFASILDDEIIKNKKVVYVIHSVPTPEPPPVWDPFGGNNDIRLKFEKLCNIADILVCVSEAEREKLIGIYPHFEEKIRVVHNGITFSNTKEKNTNYLKSRSTFGYIGRTDYRKGILECVKALTNIDAKLRLACPKNDENYVEKILTYIEGANMQDRVEFCGWCVGERKENFLDSLDALIIPSLYEPFGYIALEAMQRGLPVICSCNGGLAEILEGYKYMFNPYVEGQLEEQIELFMKDSNEEVEKQQAILLQNLEKFSALIMVRKYEKIWDELLGEV
ncbi:MAG: glycosyltransferase family 4 protein [Lachnospiraceae bacterium]|nr:glycosyltransferase family 4 protein [Lachnospiraceae bacterium]